MRAIAKLGIVTLTGGTLALGAAALLVPPTYAAPHLECGPTRQWVCVLPGCPDCYVVEFEGTVCEKTAFEKKTGRKCLPEGV